MLHNLSITTKGLILVAVPLVFELAFVFILTSKMHEAEMEAKRSALARERVAHANTLMFHTFDATMCTGAYAMGKKRVYLLNSQIAIQNAKSELDQMKILCKDDPGLMRTVQELERCANNMLALLEEFKQQSSDEIIGFAQKISMYRKFNAGVIELGVPMRRLLLEQSKVDTVVLDEEAKKRQAFESVLWGGVYANLFMAVLLAMFFFREIGARLKVVAENTKLLSMSKPLKNRLDGTDEIAKLDSVFHDMAKNLEEAARQKKEIMEMVSHDLKSPLTAVLGTLTLFEAGAFGDVTEKGKLRMQDMQADVSRLVVLINDLLDAEKLESGKLVLDLKPLEVERAIRQALLSVTPIAEKSEVTIKYVPSEIIAIADESRLVQVLVNLLSNAVKFSDQESEVEILTGADGDHITIAVVDKGRGIAPEMQGKLFDRYKQVESEDATKRGGTGLGLYISKKLVTEMGGTITLQSRLDEGSTFTIKLKRNT